MSPFTLSKLNSFCILVVILSASLFNPFCLMWVAGSSIEQKGEADSGQTVWVYKEATLFSKTILALIRHRSPSMLIKKRGLFQVGVVVELTLTLRGAGRHCGGTHTYFLCQLQVDTVVWAHTSSASCRQTLWLSSHSPSSCSWGQSAGGSTGPHKLGAVDQRLNPSQILRISAFLGCEVLTNQKNTIKHAESSWHMESTPY